MLPSIGWRIAMLAGADTGFALAPLFRSNPEAIRYVLTLDVLQLGGAIACVGLARRWGERWFSWLPVIGGRVIPRRGPVALAEPAHGRDHRVLAPSTPHRVSNGAHPVSARSHPVGDLSHADRPRTYDEGQHTDREARRCRPRFVTSPRSPSRDCTWHPVNRCASSRAR
ncbi:hypothetical protein ACSDQ9_09480 [Aestuariimicrobium soli]|uniref:hypothetical protein n=1 Tax=Aestuariimicrobium soli TaxID=2035834 RepID=UPI003EBC31AE